MKILHVIRHGTIGGCESHLLQLLKTLDGSEFESIVISLSPGEMVNELERMGIPCHVWDEQSYYKLKISKSIRKIAETMRVDLIHCHDRVAANLSVISSNALGIPLFYNVHCWSYLKYKSGFKKEMLKLNERILTRQAHVNIIASDLNQEEGVRSLNMPKSVVIPHGIDLRKFDPERPSALSRQIYGIPKDVTLVGFLARLTQKKDPLTLIRAAALALKKDRSLHFMIIGEGKLKSLCMEETRELGISNHVSFQEIKADVPTILQLFDIYCMPSQWEGLSIGLLEAMAMRKAIITSPVNSNTEIIAHQTDGMLVSPGVPEEWSEAILKLHRDPKLRRDLGKQARMMVESYYDIRTTAKRQESLYRKILKGPEKGEIKSVRKPQLQSV